MKHEVWEKRVFEMRGISNAAGGYRENERAAQNPRLKYTDSFMCSTIELEVALCGLPHPMEEEYKTDVRNPQFDKSGHILCQHRREKYTHFLYEAFGLDSMCCISFWNDRKRWEYFKDPAVRISKKRLRPPREPLHMFSLTSLSLSLRNEKVIRELGEAGIYEQYCIFEEFYNKINHFTIK